MQWGPKAAGWLFQVSHGPTPTDFSCSVLGVGIFGFWFCLDLEAFIRPLWVQWPNFAGSHFQSFCQGLRSPSLLPFMLNCVLFGWNASLFSKFQESAKHPLSQYYRTRVPGPMFYVREQSQGADGEGGVCEAARVCYFIFLTSSTYLHVTRKIFLLSPAGSNTGLLIDFY